MQTFKPGQVIPFKTILPILHKGPMNVSIVDTKTNKVIGAPLIYMAVYADETAKAIPANNLAFNVTMPMNMSTSTACRTPGECVLQWFWFGTKAEQTYESCVDFVIPSTVSAAAVPATGAPAAAAPAAAVPAAAAPAAAAPAAAATTPAPAPATAAATAATPAAGCPSAKASGRRARRLLRRVVSEGLDGGMN